MEQITAPKLLRYKKHGKKITMLTCYDATFARLVDDAMVDMVLVGDSLGMVIKGEQNTLNVTIEQVAYHTHAVANGIKRAHIVADMPFMSYQKNADEALENAAKLIQAGAHSVKMEGGLQIQQAIKKISQSGIPVVGHIGLLPQRIHEQGGFLIQGKSEPDREQLIKAAKAIEEAGAFAIVIEGVTLETAQNITLSLTIPTIGIGAGPYCDGQVLVLYDILNLDSNFSPKFVKHYLDGHNMVREACRKFVHEVQVGEFPSLMNSFENLKPK